MGHLNVPLKFLMKERRDRERRERGEERETERAVTLKKCGKYDDKGIFLKHSTALIICRQKHQQNSKTGRKM